MDGVRSANHLFFLGDLNFRIDIPESHPLSYLFKNKNASVGLTPDSTREALKEFDQLTQERQKGNIFVGLREGDFWKFKCTYKYKLGEVDSYRSAFTFLPLKRLSFVSTNRTPSWTDRILYTTHSDSPDAPDESKIHSLLYTSIPSYTTSDHVRPRPPFLFHLTSA